MKIQIDQLKEKILQGVHKLGYENEDANILCDVLLYAQMRGNNQGIPKIATGGVPAREKVQELKIVQKHKSVTLISGGHSMVASSEAAEHAIKNAKETGIGIACVNHTYTSSGAIGYYTRKVAKEGYIAFMCVGNGDWAAVAPHGSSEAKLGTNPISYAFPYNGGEVVFDTATAAIAFFGVVQAKLKGEEIPPGVAVNSNGEETTNPNDVMGTGEGEDVKGAIKTFAGFKGFGLSLFVQMMGSAFALGANPGLNTKDGAGTFILAIDPGLIGSREEYLKRSTELVKSVKSAKPIPGKEVLLPGERGDRLLKEAEESGTLEIADSIWEELCKYVEK